MWMMGYKDGGDFTSIQDSFNGRKLRHLMPRPATAAASTNPPRLSRVHGTDLLTFSHHLVSAAMVEQTKRELSTQQVVVSSRWNPTPEQLQALEELYRRGTRTPSADQIQQITAHLRRYGKIEGKNVFYWFQNHKARERQKQRRRHLESPSHDNHTQNLEKKQSSPVTGVNKTVYEVEQSKNWASSTNSSTIVEKHVSTQWAAKAGDAECKTGRCLQFDDETELQHRRNATWQMMQLSCCSSSPTLPATILSTMQPNLITTKDSINDILVKPRYNTNHSAGGGDVQTLQLFPLGSGGGHRLIEGGDETEESAGETLNSSSNITHYQFFEFLPLKN